MNKNQTDSYQSQNNSELGLIYHNVYVFIVVLFALSAFCTKTIPGVLVALFFVVAMVFLYKKTKLGYFLCLMYNVVVMIAGGMSLSISAVCFFYKGGNFFDDIPVLAEMMHSYLNDFSLVFGILFLVLGIVLIVWGLFTIKYYRKRKLFFMEDIDKEELPVSNQLENGDSIEGPFICPNCGRTRKSISDFCPFCGSKN